MSTQLAARPSPGGRGPLGGHESPFIYAFLFLRRPTDESKVFTRNGQVHDRLIDTMLLPFHHHITYRCSGLLLESYAACLSAKPLSSQYSPKRHNTVSECVAKYASALSTEAVNTANSLKYWLWVARFFVFFHRYSIGL